MKIGELAKITNLSVDTIRYYVNLGLLVPASESKQYSFSEKDIQDLKIIQRLKGYYFSLNDIHTIISFNRISNLEDYGDIEDYLEFFIQKRTELLSQKEDLESTINNLEEDIKCLEKKYNCNGKKSGVPLFFLDYLFCPQCKTSLKLTNAEIENKEILSGNLFCDCSYKAKIEDGILITEKEYKNTYDFADPDRNFFKRVSPSLISLMQKSYNWILDQLENINLDGKIIMEDHMNAYFFLYPNINSVNKNAYYIVSDKYLEMVKLYKERIDRLNLDLKILYICDCSFAYPLKPETIDIFIDFYSSNEYASFNKDYYLEKITPLFNRDVSVFGTYLHFDKGSRSAKELANFYPESYENNFKLPYFKYRYLENGGYKEKLSKVIGYTLDSGTYHKKTENGYNEAFLFHVPNEKMHLYSYVWQKK